MKKALRTLAIASGIVSIVSAAILGLLYLGDIVGYVKCVKSRITGAIDALTGANEEK